MTREALIHQIRTKKNFLCVGLDTDIEKIPAHLRSMEDPIYEFNKRIIDATSDYCVAYKLNLAFYESYGIDGWKALERTVEYIPDNIFTIADAKRGDIGNTANMYAKAFFEKLQFDSITLSPYMGSDSVTPFLQHEGKWAILLGLTSNKGSADFQSLKLNDGGELYEQVLKTSSTWGNANNTMYVIGATNGDKLKTIREIIPEHFLLVPGVGAQGGSLEDIRVLLNEDVGVLINSSRGIIYADSSPDFESEVRKEAKKMADEMAKMLD